MELSFLGTKSEKESSTASRNLIPVAAIEQTEIEKQFRVVKSTLISSSVQEASWNDVGRLDGQRLE